MNRIIKLLPSLVLYGFGLVSFFFLDIYISTTFDTGFISQWAFYKSSIFILGGFCILGFDQVMVREPNLHFFIKTNFIIQSLILSLIGTFLVYLFHPIENLVLFFITLNLFSIAIFFSGVFRANQKYTIAQLATNGWKILVVLLFFVLIKKQMLSILFYSLLIINLVLAFIYIKQYHHDKNTAKKLDYVNYRKTGIAFFLHNITLTSAVYGEQFIINLFGNEHVSSELFTYFAVFSPIILSANGFIGFIIGPKLRAKKEVTKKDYNKLQKQLIFFAIATALISLLVGFFLLSKFKHVQFENINFKLAFVVLLYCVIRTIYTASSIYLGVFGSDTYLYKTAALNWVVLIIYILLIIYSLINLTVFNLAFVIATLTAFHWLSRSIISHTYAVKYFKNE